MDESGAPIQALTQQPSPPPQQQANPLAGIMQGGQPQHRTPISKEQVIAGLHHFGAVLKQFTPLLASPMLGKGNMRPKIFDASASLIGEGIATVPEIMNGIKSLPDDPIGQKKWIEQQIINAKMAEQKIVSDYVSQGPGPEPQGPAYSSDTHKDHMSGLMSNYRR